MSLMKTLASLLLIAVVIATLVDFSESRGYRRRYYGGYRKYGGYKRYGGYRKSYHSKKYNPVFHGFGYGHGYGYGGHMPYKHGGYPTTVVNKYYITKLHPVPQGNHMVGKLGGIGDLGYGTAGTYGAGPYGTGTLGTGTLGLGLAGAGATAIANSGALGTLGGLGTLGTNNLLATAGAGALATAGSLGTGIATTNPYPNGNLLG